MNNYGNSANLALSNITVPPGTSYVYVNAKGTTAGAYPSQATMAVSGGSSALSDDPSVAGPSSPTNVTLTAADPLADLAITKAVNNATAQQGTNVTYTYNVTNNGATAVNTTFEDALKGVATYVSGSLTGAPAGAQVNTYANGANLIMRDVTIAAGATVTMSIQVNVAQTPVDSFLYNYAQVTPDIASGFRQVTTQSNTVSTKILVGCVAGSAAPSVSSVTLTNCPAPLANLGSITATNKPNNTVLTWHTAAVATTANKVADSSAVAAGTYYAAFYDNVSNCYSTVTTAVTVTIIANCPKYPGGVNTSAGMVNGIAYTLYSGYDAVLSDDIQGTIKSTGYVNNLTDPDDGVLGEIGDGFSMKFNTNLSITTAGTYQFQLAATDDQAYLILDGTPIITNAGAGTFQSANIALTVGMHVLELRFSENGGAETVNLQWRGTTAGLDVGTTFANIADNKYFISPKLSAWFKADAEVTIMTRTCEAPQNRKLALAMIESAED